jgi:hypothetical protein
MADFINSVNIRDQDLALLLPLKKQLIWLKLGNTKIGDSAMNYIGQCRMLTQLQLNHTLVTDKGLASLKSLKGLRRLNLVGTAVTAQGIQSINSLKHLKYLYLYQTGVKEKDWAVLTHDFPKTHVDSGGFTLPFLASDTVILKEPRKE